MREKSAKIHYRKDYHPSDYHVSHVDLQIQLGEQVTIVTATSHISRNLDVNDRVKDLMLYGQEQSLQSLQLNGQLLDESHYKLDDESLTIFSVPDKFVLTIISEIKPQCNTSLVGLYKSQGNFCTQCESQGFRKITYYLDRPDVMAIFTTTIIANKACYPVLLSNGNLQACGDLDNGCHFVKWHDPFPKPSYLFALVAGDLAYIEDFFITMSNRQVTLRIFAKKPDIDKCHYAMIALKKAMKWDEEHYGREYDLSIFMIVAIDDFNFGAMENKGLNIFNSQYILVKPKIATDQDYANVDTVVSHEYFHNWSGNRVTLRDWFQITLKEGLTVFRDHSFSQDVGLAAVERIWQVKRLRSLQFSEDAGPLAHPICPESYLSVDNFYTATVYDKGSEVIRMQKVILGDKAYRRGSDLYFKRHDGCAVSCEDFTCAMEDASGVDLTQFRNWYYQAGTPQLTIESNYDQSKQQYCLTVSQYCPKRPNQAEKKPYHIPLAMGLLDHNGNDIPLQLANQSALLTNGVLSITKATQRFVFNNVKTLPIPSFLRGFSAPVKLHYHYREDELAFLIAHDNDDFTRFEALQQYASNEILRLVAAIEQKKALTVNPLFIETMRLVLLNNTSSKALIAVMLTLPSGEIISQFMTPINVDAIYQARLFLMQTLAKHLAQDLLTMYDALHSRDTYRYHIQDVAKRRLKNHCLFYLSYSDNKDYNDIAMAQFKSANNMTDQLAALRALTFRDHSNRQVVLEQFYQQWHDEPLVIDKWFALQALADIPLVIEQVMTLTTHKDFDIKNPNKVRALLASFSQNLVHFHDISGRAYAFITDFILKLDKINPLVASRLAISLSKWHRYDSKRQQLITAQLQRLLQQSLSDNVYEIVTKSLSSQ